MVERNRNPKSAYISSLGRFILERRVELGLTQEEIGRRARMSHSAISRLESGDRSASRMATLVKLAGALQVPIEVLLQHSPAATERSGVGLPSRSGTVGADAAVANALNRHRGLSRRERDIVLALVRALAQNTAKGG